MVAAVVSLHERLGALHLEGWVEGRRPVVVHVADGRVPNIAGQVGLFEHGRQNALRDPQLQDLVGILHDLSCQGRAGNELPEQRHETLERGIRYLRQLSFGLLFSGGLRIHV